MDQTANKIQVSNVAKEGDENYLRECAVSEFQYGVRQVSELPWEWNKFRVRCESLQPLLMQDRFCMGAHSRWTWAALLVVGLVLTDKWWANM